MNFEKLPLNTQRAYVNAVDKSGCRIYVPIKFGDVHTLSIVRHQLENFLLMQPHPKDKK